MQPIPDSNELFETGLGSGKPYLGSPGVVEQIVRHYLLDINAVRSGQAKGLAGDHERAIRDLADGVQKVFYGQDDRFQPFAWNRENTLGRALVDQCGIGGETSDAVFRMALRIARDYLRNLSAFEDDRIGDDYFKAEIDKMVALYTGILVGNGDRRGS